jgi:hypothetical protein
MKKIILIAFSIFLSVNTAKASGPYGSIKVGNWHGGAFTDNTTGEFSNCMAAATYKSGIEFGVLVTHDLHWSLALHHKSWTVRAGQKIPVVLSFDGRSSFNVTAIGIGNATVLVPMPGNSALIKSFRGAELMSAFASGRLYQFRLTSTAALLPALVTCVKTVKAEGLQAGRVYSAPASIAQHAPLTNATSTQPANNAAESPTLQLEAMQIASNFILKASLQHPSLLPREQTPISLVSTGAAWKADNASGFVKIILTQPGTAGLDVAAAVIGNDAKACKGKFLSARNTELVDSEAVFRGMSSCEDSDHSVVAEYFIFPRKKGGFILFSVLSPTGGSNKSLKTAPTEDQKTSYRTAAYKAISN